MLVILFNLQGDSQVQICDVKYRNIRGISSSKIAVAFDYSKGKPCEKTKLNNINLTYHGDKGVVASTCSNVKGITTTKNWAYSGVLKQWVYSSVFKGL